MEASAMLDPSSEEGTLQESSDEDDVPRIPERVKDCRSFTGFWILGLCNNFSYVIMLSAAHDILSGHGDRNSSVEVIPALSVTGDVGDLSPSGGEQNGTSRYDCNPISTAAILLADILPTLLIKLTAPFYIHHIPYGYRVMCCILCAVASFLFVSLSVATWISILGVVFASISSGLGEFTFLSLTSFFHSDVVSYWSSGTGFAGLLGAFSYSGLTQSGLSPRNTVLLMLVIPVLLYVSYFYLLRRPPGLSNWRLQPPPRPPECQPIIQQRRSGRGTSGLSMWERVLIIRGLLKYMIPLGLIYFAEYFINQGLFELLYFRDSLMDHSSQYRWYQTLYQVGVFVSRSSASCLWIKKIWILTILQLLNLVLLLCDVWYAFIPNIWIMFAIILYEGLLGGAGYVNTFRNITLESPEEEREFAMGAASVADTLGIAISGAGALPFHNRMCRLD